MKFEVYLSSFCSDSFFAAGFLVRVLLLRLPSLPAFCLCFFRPHFKGIWVYKVEIASLHSSAS